LPYPGLMVNVILEKQPRLAPEPLVSLLFCTYIFTLSDPEFSRVLCIHDISVSSILVYFYFVIDPGNNHTDHKNCHNHFHRIPSFFSSC
jgi:hypothetical protein